MADSVREAALKALFDLLLTVAGPEILRDAPESHEVKEGGLIVLRDGDPGEPEIMLSPTGYAYEHRAELVVKVRNAKAEQRNPALDAILQAIGAALDADPTLGGAVDLAVPSAPDTQDDSVAGAQPIKAALVTVTLSYFTPTPLG